MPMLVRCGWGTHTISRDICVISRIHPMSSLCKCLPASVLFLAVLFCQNSLAAVFSVRDGDWSNTTTWSTGTVPLSTDSIYIRHKVFLDQDVTLTVPAHLYVDTTGILCGHYDVTIAGGVQVLNEGIIRIEYMDLSGHYLSRDYKGLLMVVETIYMHGADASFQHLAGCGVRSAGGTDFDCNDGLSINPSSTICQEECLPYNVTGVELHPTITPSRQWFIQGATPAFSTDDAPEICFNTAGTFEVKLVTSYYPCHLWDTITTNITVQPGAIVSIEGLEIIYCENDQIDTLTGVPPGGVFSGPGIIDDHLFSPKIAADGNHTITYQIPGNCHPAAVVEVEVREDSLCNVGVEEYLFGEVKVFPNPFEQQLLIQLTGEREAVMQVELRSVHGKLIQTASEDIRLHENRITFSVNEQLASGVYFLTLYAGGGNRSFKLVRQ